MFRQCVLKRDEVEQTTWLPEAFAFVGRVLRLRKRVGNGCVVDYTEWDNGWMVVSVGEERLPESDLREHEHSFYRYARKGKNDEVAYYWS